MGFKLSSAIAIARGVLLDRKVAYRYSEADLLEYGNGALRALTSIAPHLLYTDGEVTCIANQARQHLFYDDAFALVEVRRIKNGNVILQADRAAMDAFMPGWVNATSAAAINWFQVADDKMRFDLYPPAPNGQIVEVLYIRIPGPYTSDDDTGLPISITEAVADYMVGYAESRNDESVNSNRAAQFIASFTARLGAIKG